MMMFIFFLALLLWTIHIYLKVSDLEATIQNLKLEFFQTDSKTSLNHHDEEIIISDNITQDADDVIEEFYAVPNIDKIEISSNEDDKNSENLFDSNIVNDELLTNIYTQDKEQFSFENFFIGNIFNIIGAIAIIIGCAIFVKLIQPYIIFTPLLKTLIGLITGSAMVIGGCFIKKDTLKIYSEILTGTGFAVLFIIIYCTTILFKTFSFGTCSILGILILLASYYIADKQKTSSMLTISLIGGYLNVFLVSSEAALNITFIYLIFLNLLSIIFILRNPDKSILNTVNIITTLIFSAILQLINNNNMVSIAYPVTLWAVYLIFDFLMRINKSESYNKESDFNWLNLACLFVHGFIIYWNNTLYLGCLLACSAIVYGIITAYFIIHKSGKYKTYLDIMLIALLVSVYFICEDLITRIALWSTISIVLSYITSKYNADILKSKIIIFLSCAVTSLFFVKEIYSTVNISEYIPIFNTRLLAFIFPLSGFYISHLLINKLNDENSKDISAFLKFCSITLLYLFIIFELNDFINIKMNSNVISDNFIKSMLYPIIGFKYAIQMKRYEMISLKELFNTASILVFAVSSIALLISGFNYTPLENFIPAINIRFMAFICAIGSSILFAKWTKLDIYKYIAIVLSFILMSTETIDFIQKYDFTANYIISILWVLYVGIITTIGIFKDNKILKNSGIWLSFITLGRIFLYDLANIESIYKLIIFITLGTIFMVTSYLYNKNKK